MECPFLAFRPVAPITVFKRYDPNKIWMSRSSNRPYELNYKPLNYDIPNHSTSRNDSQIRGWTPPGSHAEDNYGTVKFKENRLASLGEV
jgi:hypothetical protein